MIKKIGKSKIIHIYTHTSKFTKHRKRELVVGEVNFNRYFEVMA